MKHISRGIKHLISFAAFLLIFVLLFSHVQKILTHSDLRSYQMIHNYYDEEEDSLDAVYIGSSAVYAFWNPLLGWKNHGITVYPYCCPAMPMLDLTDLVKEVRKTQPNAVIIIGYTTVDAGKTTATSTQIHYLTDYMPFSENKVSLISFYARGKGLTFKDSLEYYFPIIRYHERWPWSSLEAADFNRANNGLKGTAKYGAYLDKVRDVSEERLVTDEAGELSEEQKKAFDDVIAYCKEEGVRLLFTDAPQARKESDAEVIKRINAATAYLKAKGADVLDLLVTPEAVGLDLKNDYYNKLHTNIHGSAKYTDYFSEYLIDHYGFTDKRGDDAYASWDEGVRLYAEEGYMGRLLDFEQDGEPRDSSIAAPLDLTVVSVAGADDVHEDVTLSWLPSEGADGYRVYLKLSGQTTWNLVADTEGGSTSELAASAQDDVSAAAIRSGGEYAGYAAAEDGKCTVTFVGAERKFTLYYRVVPYSVTDGAKVYGNYSLAGISCEGPGTGTASSEEAAGEETAGGEDESAADSAETVGGEDESAAAGAEEAEGA